MLLLVAFFGLALVAEAKVVDQRVSDEVRNAEYAKRQPVAEKWISSAREVAQFANDREANEVMRFIEKCAIVVGPYVVDGKTATVLLDEKDVTCILGIQPLLHEDQKLGGFWKEAFEQGQQAFLGFAKQFPIITVLDDGMNRKIMGAILLHEAAHALIQLNPRYEKPVGEKEEFQDRVFQEYQVYSMEFRLLEKVGGKEYLDLLQKEINRIEPVYRNENGVPDPDLVISQEIGEKVFPDSSGKKVSTPLFWAHAVFKVIEKVHGKTDEAEIGKLNFLHMAYDQGLMH